MAAMKPHQAGGGPGDEKIRELVAAGSSASTIATTYGVRRQSAEYWMKKAGIKPAVSRMRHTDFLPWPLNPRDAWDGVANGLRAWSAERQGATVAPNRLYQLNALRDYLTECDLVVAYDYDKGFSLVPRDPEIDDPNLPVRRPT